MRNAYPMHTGEDFRTGSEFQHGRYTISLRPASRGDIENEGKADILKGLHPEKQRLVQQEAGLKTSIGQTTRAQVHDHSNGQVSYHHIFQTKDKGPLTSVASLIDNDIHDKHREVLKAALSQSPDKD